MAPVKKLLLLFFILCASRGVKAQSCTIVSDSVVCLEDFIGFGINSGNASSYSWDMDEGKTSFQRNPTVKYNSPGQKNISVTVQLSNGGTCKASKKIFVHDSPKARFNLLAHSEFCLSRNKICFTDSSRPGLTGSALVKRVILFGDGDADLTLTPAANRSFCHTYGTAGSFNLTMEITDSKGCEALIQQNVTVIQDAKTTFRPRILNSCNMVDACFDNTTALTPADVEFFLWDLGDGTKDSTNWMSVCHKYTVQGTYSVQLIVKAKNGCTDTLRADDIIKVIPFAVNLVKDKYTHCLDGNFFSFTEAGSPKDEYYWRARDSTNFFLPYVKGTNKFDIDFDLPGKKYIQLMVSQGNCKNQEILDSVEVWGPKSYFSGRNTSLCAVGDTSYFCDASMYYGSYHALQFWDLGDPACPPCTTDTRNGLNIGMNCRYSKDKNPVHKYNQEGCYPVTLQVEDTVSGCKSGTTGPVVIGLPDTDGMLLQVKNEKACTGNTDTRVFFFSLMYSCHRFQLCPDSAADPTRFYHNKAQWSYDFTGDTSRNITIGIVLEGGPDSLASCPGNTSSANHCYDTIWYHHAINVLPEPDPAYEIYNRHTCLFSEVTATLLDSTQYNVKKMVMYWGDGTADSAYIAPGDSLMPSLKHAYQKEGSFLTTLFLFNDRDCEIFDTLRVSVGHYSNVFFENMLCAGESVAFKDSVFYYNDSIEYWKENNGIETMRWDFGDNDTAFGPNMSHTYTQAGLYKAKLITSDKSSCTDTLHFNVSVGGVRAFIAEPRDKFLCSEIVQLFDSSQLTSKIPGDRIKEWNWDFGDGTKPSYLQHPWHYYPSNGEFKITLTVTTLSGCKHSISKIIFIDGPQPLFSFVSDSIGCVPFTVELKNLSKKTGSWIWRFGDLDSTTYSTIDTANAIFTYKTPGTYYLHLYGADSVLNPNTGSRKFCSSTWPDSGRQMKVIVLPIPKVDFTMPGKVCKNEWFTLTDKSDSRYTNYHWNMGNGFSEGGNSTVFFRYMQTGTYMVTYTPTYTPGPEERACFDSISKPIEVIDIKADFDVDLARSKGFNLKFTNKSSGGVRYEWTFGHPVSGSHNFSDDEHPWHNYNRDTGNFKVCLKSYNELNCWDTICKIIRSEYVKDLFIPNIFTPGNNDDYNDDFDILIEGEETYKLKIYNRWGELVFEGSEDGFPHDGINWNGNFKNDGNPCPDGVYYVVFHYKFFYEEPLKYTGTVTLLRK